MIDATVEANPDGKPLVDTDGNPMQGDYVWQFGVAPPKVVFITPNNGATLVGVDTPIVVQFNQPIKLSFGSRACVAHFVRGQVGRAEYDGVE